MEDLKTLHHWDVLALSCIDGRFIKRVADWVSKEAGEVYDYRSEVGSSKAIIDSPDDRERFFNVVDVAIRLHSIKEIWLIDHIDCGAYGGSKMHVSPEAELEFHVSKLQGAKKIIAQKYPELAIKMIYASWDEFVEIS